MISESTNSLPIERTSVYTLPKFLSEIEHITTVDTGGLEFVICCDRLKLYIFPLIVGTNKPLGNIHQSLPIPNIKSLRTIAKNYLMIETENKYIGIFQIIKSTAKQPSIQKPANLFQINAVKVEFSEVLKWRTFSCHFIRQVMENLFEVQVFFTDVEFQIFQFTIKNKRGSMSFTISQNGKIQKCNKKQLYGSKCFFNIGRKLMYWLKNFSDKQFVIQEISIQQPFGPNKLLNEPLAYFGVQRSEEYKHVYPNLMIRDCINPAKRFPLKIDKDSFLNELKAEIAQISPTKKKQNGQQNPFNDLVEQSSYLDNITQIFDSLKITTFTDLLMVQNKSKKEVEIYQIKGDGSELIGKENSQIMPLIQSKQKKPTSQGTQMTLKELRKWQWHFGNSKKLIAIDKLGFQLKYIQDISLQKQNQSIMEAQVVNMNEKVEEPKQGVEIQKSEEKKIESNSESQSFEELQQEKSESKQEDENEPKRKFSKEELQKFCEEFKEEDTDKYVNKQLIKKVDEVSNWVKKQVPVVEKHSQVNKGFNMKLKNPPSTEEVKKQEPQIKIEQKSQVSPKQTVKSAQTNEVGPVKKQKLISTGQQTSTNIKEKPPMKIIQRSKISVAKTFQPENESKANQDENKREVKIETFKPKDQPQISKTENEQTVKLQKQGPNPFAKFVGKGQNNQQTTEEKQKKRFMKNHLSQERKEETSQVEEKQTPSTEQQVNQEKSALPQKEQKVKFNVITRASLLKKKEAQTAEDNTNIEKTSETKQQVKSQSNKSLTEEKKTSTVELIKESEIQSRSQQIASEQQPLKEQTSPQTQVQSEPKTKFIPSIDVRKASKNHLNDCDFLSQDSVSNDGKDGIDQKISNKQENVNEQSIEEEIDGQPNDVQSNQKQADLQHLIDDDIAVEKKEVSNVQSKAPKEEKLSYVNPDEQIQKFCNNLLDDKETPKYQKKDSHSCVIIKEQSKSLSSQNTSCFKLETSGSVNSKANFDKKPEEDEMTKFNSLLFKTSIKRTNIFSENSQNDDKKQQSSKDDQVKELKNSETPPEIKEVEQPIEIIGNQKQSISPKSQNKKSKDWHGSSSESEKQNMQEVTEVKRQLPKNQQTGPSEVLTDLINKKQSLSPIEQNQNEELQTKQTKSYQPPKTASITQQNFERKNPFFQVDRPKSQNSTAPVIQKKYIFKEDVQTNFDQSSEKGNHTLNPFLTALQASSLQFFKKNQESGQNPFLFGIPPPNVIGGSNSTTLKKFLSEREHKKHEQHKKDEDTGKDSLIVGVKNTTNEVLSQQGKALFREVVPPFLLQTKKPSERKTSSQQLMIPTSALPQIQQLISKYEQSTIQLLEQQQKSIIKSLQQIPQTHNPYNKNTSLLLPEEIKEEIIKQSKNSVKKWLSTKMLDKIQLSFREIMQEHKVVYQEALKFYENEARKKITTMQLEYQQQSAILMDIQNVSANMCAALQGSVLQGEELHTYQLKEWKRQIQHAQTVIIDPLAAKIQDTKAYFDHRNKNLQSMTDQLREIKEILKEKLRKKQELKELKEKKKLQKQLRLKLKLQEEAKLQLLKMKEESKKKSKKHKNIDENEGHVSFQNYPNPKFHQGQHYGRQPYPYY